MIGRRLFSRPPDSKLYKRKERVMFRIAFSSIFIVLSFFFMLLAEEESRIDLPESVVFRPHLYGHFQTGQIVQGTPRQEDRDFLGYAPGQHISHLWYENAIIESGFDAIYRDQLKLTFSLGTKLYFSFPVLQTARYTQNLRQDVYLDELYAKYHIGDAAMPFFLGQVGFFKFKYNPDGRDFGDYLFRTGTYPIWFDMPFDFPAARLLGLHEQSNFFESLKLDLLLISSTVTPAMNWSLAGIADYDVARLHLIDIGAGIDFAHLFSVYNNQTYPKFGGDPTTPSTPSTNDRYLTNMRVNGVDTAYDTAYYTFKGTKIMGRISIDPKALFPKEVSQFFGENDLKLYGEADIIGLKSYPDSGLTQGDQKDLVAPSYNKLLQKMPVTVGFNFPTFKLLDVLNGELEWFGAQYYNDASYVINKGQNAMPLPYDVGAEFWNTGNGVKSQIKWSIYAKKTLAGGHFAITGQIGRDHILLPCAAYDNQLWNELEVEAKDWGWNLKTSWMF
jgi:hypothetical protein